MRINSCILSKTDKWIQNWRWNGICGHLTNHTYLWTFFPSPPNRGCGKNPLTAYQSSTIPLTVRSIPLNRPFMGLPGVSWYQKKHSPTHTHKDHQLSFISFFHLLWSIASSMFNLCAWQTFLYDLSPSPLWSTFGSGTLHFILHMCMLHATK